MSYLVFARKFRPQDFDQVVGQDAIVTTLKNAISQDRISQNFLFSGPRGVGKTSTARILAKALNCQKGPTVNPCQTCPSCVEITQGNSLDVLEIDGASNRGIDEIRNLRETVKFKPIQGKVKIYIIDEVHMLTTEAFNALLKTLEEPPPHVKFVFATTESHKVPLTILSRCQRFNFKRIPVKGIAEKLQEICKKEKIKHDKNALFQIAKSSDGALRDAEGLLDQLVSFSEGKIKEEDVLMALGLASEEIYFAILEAFKKGDAKKIFTLIDDLYNDGKDLVQFAKGLLEIFRHLLLFQCSEGIEKFVEVSEAGLRELKQRKQDFTKSELLLGLSLLSNLQAQLRRNMAPPKLLLETACLKLMHLDGLKAVENLSRQTAGPGSSPANFVRQSPSFSPLPQTALPAVPLRPPVSKSAKETSSSAESTQATVLSGSLPADDFEMTIGNIESIWPRVVEYVKAKRMSTGLFLSESQPIEVTEVGVTMGLPAEFQFHKDMLERESNRNLIDEAFSVIGGRKIRVSFVITKLEREQETQPAEEEAGNLPEIINEAMNIFEGAKIIRKE
ncbi:MAG: DNA polymerase III subunit gamma/tau [Candidatus Omnitrophica bacterium]|nr:DNA polymerase III subunit gamma/tau [Candidatus Omnitrophota bacterium]